MTAYASTVRLLFDVNHGDTDIPDALNSILTEQMRKYAGAQSCLIDWQFVDPSRAAIPISVDLGRYEPDESEFPSVPDAAPQASVLDPTVIITLRDCIGALDACLTQIGQMSGMFDDSDGTIQDAVGDAEEAMEKARRLADSAGSGRAAALTTEQAGLRLTLSGNGAPDRSRLISQRYLNDKMETIKEAVSDALSLAGYTVSG